MKSYLRTMMLFLNGAEWQRGDGKIAVDAAVEGLEAKIRGQALREPQLHVAVHGPEIGIFTRILAKGNLDGTIHSTRRPRTGHVVHFDVAIDIAHKKNPVDVAHQNAALIHSLDFDVDVARNAELKIHLDDITLEFAAAASIVAIAAERPVHIELQGACLLGDVEGDFLAIATMDRSEEHTSNSSHQIISYAVFCLKKKTNHGCKKSLCELGRHHSTTS